MKTAPSVTSRGAVTMGAAALWLQFLATPPTLAWLRVTSAWPEGSNFPARLRDGLARQGFVPARQEDAGDDTKVAFATAPRYGGVDFTYRNYGRERLDDVGSNYSREVVSKVRDVIGRVRDGAHGLIIISGPPGTGKTHLIRAVMTELSSVRRAVVCVPPLEFLSNASLLLEAASSVDRALLVFEDLGDVLCHRHLWSTWTPTPYCSTFRTGSCHCWCTS